MKLLLAFFFLFVRIHVQSTDYMRGMAIYGLETPSKAFVCEWAHPPEFYIDKLCELGFNLIRIPFSREYFTLQDFSRLDRIIQYLYQKNMNVVLDLHRIWNSHQGPPEEGGVNIDDIVKCWIFILRRYKDYPNVVGHNAYNEYQGKDIKYLTSYTEYVFNHIEAEFPGRFIHFATGTQWSGVIHDFSLEHLPYHDRIMYSVHKYHFSGKADEEDWEHSFGDDFPCHKIVVGEWGWKQQNANEVEWAKRFILYLKAKGILNTCFWTIAHSGDTDGLWYDDCENVNWEKYNLLKTLWSKTNYLRRQLIPIGNNLYFSNLTRSNETSFVVHR